MAKYNIINLEEISAELHRIMENMETDNDDQVVAYYGELRPRVDKLDEVIAELKRKKD